jgi:hypothetical protein
MVNEIVVFDVESNKIGYVTKIRTSLKLEVLWSGDEHASEVTKSARYIQSYFGSPRFFSKAAPALLLDWYEDDPLGLLLAQIQDDYLINPKLPLLKSATLRAELNALGLTDDLLNPKFDDCIKTLVKHRQFPGSSSKYLRFTPDKDLNFFRTDLYSSPWWVKPDVVKILSDVSSGKKSIPVFGADVESFLGNNQQVNDENVQLFLTHATKMIDRINKAENHKEQKLQHEMIDGYLRQFPKTEVVWALLQILNLQSDLGTSHQASKALLETISNGHFGHSENFDLVGAQIFKSVLRGSELDSLPAPGLIRAFATAFEMGVSAQEIGMQVEKLLRELQLSEILRNCVENRDETRAAFRYLDLCSQKTQEFLLAVLESEPELLDESPIWLGIRDMPLNDQSFNFLNSCLKKGFASAEILREFTKWLPEANLDSIVFICRFGAWLKQADPISIAQSIKTQLSTLPTVGDEIRRIISNENSLIENVSQIEVLTFDNGVLSRRNLDLEATVLELRDKIQDLENRIDANLHAKGSALQAQASMAVQNSLLAFARVLATLGSAGTRIETTLLQQVLGQAKLAGLTALASAGDCVAFDPKYHDDFAEALAIGEKCIVLSPGFSSIQNGIEEVVWKASVISTQ